jgi:uncharacterized protein YjiS (DUF1127 family)
VMGSSRSPAAGGGFVARLRRCARHWGTRRRHCIFLSLRDMSLRTRLDGGRIDIGVMRCGREVVNFGSCSR